MSSGPAIANSQQSQDPNTMTIHSLRSRLRQAGYVVMFLIGSALSVTLLAQQQVVCVAGCGGGVGDTDDGTIATGQTVGLSAALAHLYDGTNWRRWVSGAGVNGVGAARVTVATDDEINDDLDTIAGATTDIETAIELMRLATFVDDDDFTDGVSSGFLHFAVAESAAPTTVTEGDAGALAMTLNRALKVSLYDTSGTALTSSDKADEAAFTYATSTVTPIGFVAESTTDTLADGTIGAPVMTLSRYIRTTPTAYSTGGGTVTRYISAGATEDEHAVCTGPCTLYAVIVTNVNAAVRYLKCENDTAANTAPGTDTPEFSIAIPGPATGGGAAWSIPVGGAFTTALTCWIVTGMADSDVAEVAANELMVNYVTGQ